MTHDSAGSVHMTDDDYRPHGAGLVWLLLLAGATSGIGLPAAIGWLAGG